MEISNLLKVFISKDIANVVQKYFYHNNPLDEDNYIELQKDNISSFDLNSGNINIIRLMIQKDKGNYYNRWNNGLKYACYKGHMNIVELMIQKGANYWNNGMMYACRGGHMEIVEFMIQKGANDFEGGLYEAYIGDHLKIMELMNKNCDYINLKILI